jgi:hypothetical protein
VMSGHHSPSGSTNNGRFRADLAMFSPSTTLSLISGSLGLPLAQFTRS